MKKTICDKCGAETEGRHPDFYERLVETSGGRPRYIDLCPECTKEFDRVRTGAYKTYNATVDAWFNCVLSKDEKEETL